MVPAPSSFLSYAPQFIWLAAPQQHLRGAPKKEGPKPSSGELSIDKVLYPVP